MCKLTIKPAFFDALDEAYNWYEDASVGLGERLLKEIDTCFKKLEQNPLFYSIYKDSYRRFHLERFPYQVLYEVIESEVIIYVMFHTRQNK